MEMLPAITSRAEADALDREIEAWAPPADLQSPGSEDLEMIRKVREAARYHEGGGGMCHTVSEWIEAIYGWRRESGSYCKGTDVCVSPHYFNFLPNGDILDATADQLGEGHDIRIVAVGDPEHGRYDEEWFDDWNPSTSDYARYIPTGARQPEHYRGPDGDQQVHLETERGPHWFVTDPTQLRAYLDRQLIYAKGTPYQASLTHQIDCLT